MTVAGLPGAYREAVRDAQLTRRVGVVRQVVGLAVEAEGLEASVGELCHVSRRGRRRHPHHEESVAAEVVAIQAGRVTLMPYGPIQGLAAGCEVVADGVRNSIPAGPELLGRVIDGFAQPLDGRPAPVCANERSLKLRPVNPLLRPRISQVLETGIRCIDGLLTIGQGQRVGIFAGSGVGKSTLLGMIARHVRADVNVIALIGERGREVREFIEKQLGPDGLQRSVVVVATSDQPALARVRAAYAAVAIAEHFRDQGQQVLLTMDSATRFAMARREIGLAAGEPPTSRGYTPSVFSELPQLCERCGTAPSGGAITALMTVLVEGDDLNEPVSDALRSILDGHIVLSRELAHAGRYPAIDILKSASRLMPDITQVPQRELAEKAIRHIALLERNRQMIDIGAYQAGSNPALDEALGCEARLLAWLRQRDGGVPHAEALGSLAAALATNAASSRGVQ